MVVLHGAGYSVYSRIVRLVLAEKAIAHDFVEIDVFAPGGPPAGHLARHPFGRIPVLEHDGFVLYETAAITRYLDEAFPGPRLVPEDARRRARTAQIVGLLDAYAFRTLVYDVFVERQSPAEKGRPADEGLIAAALPRARTILSELDRLGADAGAFSGDGVTLADLHALPMLAYFALTEEGRALLAETRRVGPWLIAVAGRPTVAATRYAEECGPG